MSDAAGTKKRKKEDDDKITEKAAKWAGEFERLEEDDQYSYIEAIARSMTKMHMQFLQGIMGFDDGEEEGEFDEDGEEEEDGEEDAGDEEEDAADEDADVQLDADVRAALGGLR